MRALSKAVVVGPAVSVVEAKARASAIDRAEPSRAALATLADLVRPPGEGCWPRKW